MKINLMSKVLIGTMALTSCQKPQAAYHFITPVAKEVDCFISRNTNNEKTFDLIKDITDFFTKGATSFNIKGGERKPSSLKPSIKRPTRKKKAKPANTQRSAPKPTPVTPVTKKLSPTVNNNNFWVSGNNISYAHPANYTVPEGACQNAKSIARANGISLYRLKTVNSDINLDSPIPAGTTITIPGRYIITPGSVRNFDDVVKTTKVNKHYIKDILIGIEGRNQKPDLVCKSDNVRSKEYPHGCPTIGFGHTGDINGENIVVNKTKITDAQAYELLAQDILDAKIDAMVYMGKDLFNKAPESVQTGIIDIVFNKGVEPFTRSGSPTALIKGDLERGNYCAAAAHTALKTKNRGLKKRNVYRIIMSSTNLSQPDKNKTLIIARPHYLDALSKFPGKSGHRERGLMQSAWYNVKNGKTWGFFNN
ncbi:MAG: hypothetical protein K6E29_07820 [Cyanobacteria bacterium RUI128]|nr:hypothetical protein [Cyanobacteria bacterium RUI128]